MAHAPPPGGLLVDLIDDEDDDSEGRPEPVGVAVGGAAAAAEPPPLVLVLQSAWIGSAQLRPAHVEFSARRQQLLLVGRCGLQQPPVQLLLAASPDEPGVVRLREAFLTSTSETGPPPEGSPLLREWACLVLLPEAAPPCFEASLAAGHHAWERGAIVLILEQGQWRQHVRAIMNGCPAFALLARTANTPELLGRVGRLLQRADSADAQARAEDEREPSPSPVPSRPPFESAASAAAGPGPRAVAPAPPVAPPRLWPHLSAPFSFPPGNRDAVTLCDGDLQRLQPGEFLNDAVIDAQLMLTRTQMAARGQWVCHCFNTLFYPKLLAGGAAAVARWTRGLDLFCLPYLLIPIHKDVHWSLAVIINPGGPLPPPPTLTIDLASDEADGDALRRSERQRGRRDGGGGAGPGSAAPAAPAILHLDSLPTGHQTGGPAGVGATLMAWLTAEWYSRHRGEAPREYSTANTRVLRPRVPRQNNFCDCGVFLVMFAERFAHDFDPATGGLATTNPPLPFLTPHWFQANAARKRWAIANNLVELAGGRPPGELTNGRSRASGRAPATVPASASGGGEVLLRGAAGTDEAEEADIKRATHLSLEAWATPPPSRPGPSRSVAPPSEVAAAATLSRPSADNDAAAYSCCSPEASARPSDFLSEFPSSKPQPRLESRGEPDSDSGGSAKRPPPGTSRAGSETGEAGGSRKRPGRLPPQPDGAADRRAPASAAAIADEVVDLS